MNVLSVLISLLKLVTAEKPGCGRTIRTVSGLDISAVIGWTEVGFVLGIPLLMLQMIFLREDLVGPSKIHKSEAW
jgi:hypothetical protein